MRTLAQPKRPIMSTLTLCTSAHTLGVMKPPQLSTVYTAVVDISLKSRALPRRSELVETTAKTQLRQSFTAKAVGDHTRGTDILCPAEPCRGSSPLLWLLDSLTSVAAIASVSSAQSRARPGCQGLPLSAVSWVMPPSLFLQ